MAQQDWEKSFDDLDELHPKHRLHVLAIALVVPYAGGPLAEPAEFALLANSIDPRLQRLVRRELVPTEQELRTIYLVRQWLETLDFLLEDS